VRVTTYAWGKVITIRFAQRVHSCIAVLLSRLPVIVTVPIVEAGLFCHGRCAFPSLGPHGPYSGHPTPSLASLRPGPSRSVLMSALWRLYRFGICVLVGRGEETGPAGVRDAGSREMDVLTPQRVTAIRPRQTTGPITLDFGPANA
jgi:hypothetical protein